MASSERPLRDLDWLVFSAHKTATQSSTAMLRAAGLRARHGHNLINLGIEPGTLADHLAHRDRAGSSRLQVVSVFRLPIERHVSSLFQWYGTRPLERGLVDDPQETVIAREDDATLAARLEREITEETLIGREESILILCDEVGIRPTALHFDPSAGSGTSALPTADLHLLRFDQIKGRIGPALRPLVGRDLPSVTRNKSDEKWYAERYKRFRDQLRLPAAVVSGVHEARRDLIELFYPGGYNEVLARELDRWAT